MYMCVCVYIIYVRIGVGGIPVCSSIAVLN